MMMFCWMGDMTRQYELRGNTYSRKNGRK